MNKFIEQMMELGAMEDRACSKTERNLLIKEAEELYDKHLGELKLLGIVDAAYQFVGVADNKKPTEEEMKRLLSFIHGATWYHHKTTK
jgi:hypothetical protein